MPWRARDAHAWRSSRMQRPRRDSARAAGSSFAAARRRSPPIVEERRHLGAGFTITSGSELLLAARSAMLAGCTPPPAETRRRRSATWVREARSLRLGLARRLPRLHSSSLTRLWAAWWHPALFYPGERSFPPELEPRRKRGHFSCDAARIKRAGSIDRREASGWRGCRLTV